MKRCFLILAWVVLVGCERPVFEVVGGSGFSDSDLKDRWLVINYWATWCGPCITEIPEFNEIHHNPRSDLIVLGVNFDAPSERSTQQADLEKMKIEFPVVIQDPAVRCTTVSIGQASVAPVARSVYSTAPSAKALSPMTILCGNPKSSASANFAPGRN